MAYANILNKVDCKADRAALRFSVPPVEAHFYAYGVVPGRDTDFLGIVFVGGGTAVISNLIFGYTQNRTFSVYTIVR